MPCNVVVQEGPQSGTTTVEAVDPVVQMSVASSEGLAKIAEDVRSSLQRLLKSLDSEV